MRGMLRWGLVSALFAGAVAGGGALAPVGSGEPEAQAVIRNTAGDVVGVARLSEEDGLVEIKVRVWGIPAGFHGFHVHAKGLCEPAPTDAAGNPLPAFFTALGHLKEVGQNHPSHDGDLPVVLALGGTLVQNQRVSTDRFTITGLLDADGSAFIVHDLPDNYTDPATGAAGARIACGVITTD